MTSQGFQVTRIYCSHASRCKEAWPQTRKERKMPKRCYFHGSCSASLFNLPKDVTQREKWLKFIFNHVPEYYKKDITLCAQHFTKDSFQNWSQFRAGFSQKLLLKEGAVPTIKDDAGDCELQPVSISICCNILHA